jgi:hypothetical protein
VSAIVPSQFARLQPKVRAHRNIDSAYGPHEVVATEAASTQIFYEHFINFLCTFYLSACAMVLGVGQERCG